MVFNSLNKVFELYSIVNLFQTLSTQIFKPVVNQNLVVNLSDCILNENEKSVLEKGLKFCPTTRKADKAELLTDLERFSRSARLALRFDQAVSDPSLGNSFPHEPFKHRDFKIKSTWNPPGPTHLEHILNNIQDDIQDSEISHPKFKNLSQQQYKAISSLRSNTNIVIKEADKGSAVVIQNRNDYINEGLRQLTDQTFYTETENDLTSFHSALIKKEVQNLYTMNEISEQAFKYLTFGNERTPEFYMLPKIHKNRDNPPGRPIVSGNDGPTEKISQLVDCVIKEYVPIIRSYIRDSTHFINKLSKITEIPDNCILVTFDVQSLYTNIPHRDGIRAIAKTLSIYRTGTQNPTNQTIIKLLKLVLECNNFRFNNRHFLQISGTAMGTKLAPSYANIFLGDFEEEHIYTYRLQPLFWGRFIDDCFSLWQHGMHELDLFTQHLNSRNPSIQFTREDSTSHIPFLDLVVRILQGEHGNSLVTSLYTKPTDTHSYLLYSSAHTMHNKNSIPYSQFLRIRRICSEWDDTIHHCYKLAHYLYNRQYPLDIIFNGFTKAMSQDRSTLLAETAVNPDSTDKKLFFVTTHNDTLPDLKGIIDKHWNKLARSSATRNLTDTQIIYSKRRPQNLRDLLVRAKLPQVPPRQKTLKVCDKEKRGKCKICPVLNREGKFTHPQTNQRYTTMKNITCDSTNLVYLIKCTICGMLYVGQTGRSIGVRISEHKSCIRNNRHDLYRHFMAHNAQSDAPIEVFILEFIKLPPSHYNAETMRLQKETNWIYRLNTLAPSGLNLADK